MKTPVSQYFDSIADDYSHRYDASERPYHSYLHQQRLRIAARDIDFAGQRILDIGAGTGPVYDLVTQQVADPDYFACDISAGQSFHTFAYLPDVATHPLRLHHAEWYNASLTPINTLLPRLSFWVARWADKHLPEGLRPLCCADIVAVYTK